MNKLSRREKVLLYALLIVAVIAAGWFLIKPALEDADTADSALIEAEMQKDSIEQVIATRASYAESIELSRARIAELENEFLPVMTNDDLDRYVTGLLQRNGLVAESLLISPSADTASSLATLRLNVKVTATGRLEQFMALVERVSELKGIRIADLVVRENGEKTQLVPMSEEEIAEAKVAPVPKKTTKKTDKKTEIPANMKEVTVMEYGVEIGFEVVELDEALFAAMMG